MLGLLDQMNLSRTKMLYTGKSEGIGFPSLFLIIIQPFHYRATLNFYIELTSAVLNLKTNATCCVVLKNRSQLDIPL